ncbi:MAG: PspA/IM30 family protein, partial [Jaaginema sp. PMC 1078.18]|nr:PspA/IM30 family protein [Jaaginema sp. PMC 1078.18]
AQLALQKGDENLAREALVRKKGAAETAQVLKTQLDTQTQQVQTLKKQLVNLESKIAEAKTKKNMLQARAQAAKANQQLQSTVNNISNNGSMAAFERMEDKVVSLEAQSQAAHELGGGGLEDQFKQLESGSDVDDELLALKAEMSGEALPGASPTQQALPEAESETPTEVDDELEALRNQLRNS